MDHIFKKNINATVQKAHKRLDAAMDEILAVSDDPAERNKITLTTTKSHRRLDAAASIIFNAIDEEEKEIDALFDINNTVEVNKDSSEVIDHHSRVIKHETKDGSPTFIEKIDVFDYEEDDDFSFTSIESKTISLSKD